MRLFCISTIDPSKFDMHSLAHTPTKRYVAYTGTFKHRDKLTSVPLMKRISLLS